MSCIDHDTSKKHCIRVSLLGDVMCESPLLKAAKNRSTSSEYDFSGLLGKIKSLWANSDYVIANLETPITRSMDDLTNELYSFNTPVQLLYELKSAGISMVLTGNNHCFDRGQKGCIETIQILDKFGFDHTGTFLCGEEKYKVIEIGDTKISIVSCTSSVNSIRTGYIPADEEVILLERQKRYPTKKGKIDISSTAKSLFVRNVLGDERWLEIKKKLGKKPNSIRYDDIYEIDSVEPYMTSLTEIIKKADQSSDVVIVCPHMGGQFNVEPGLFSVEYMRHISNRGASAVVGSHPHVAQRYERINNVPCFYSLGNVSMSMSTKYIIMDNLPNYGIIVHLYIADKRIIKASYSIIVIHEEIDGFLSILPISEAYACATNVEKASIYSNYFEIVNRVGGDRGNDKMISDEIVCYAS